MKRVRDDHDRREIVASTVTRRCAALARAQRELGISMTEIERGAGRPGVSVRAVRAVERMPSGGACFICGPSGSGKSTHLRRLVDEIITHGGTVLELDGDGAWTCERAADRRVIELGAGLSMKRWLAILSHAGLAEARLFARRLCELSDGQRRRAKVAMLLAKAERRHGRWRAGAREQHAGFAGVWIVADELTSGLDRQTAVSLAAGLSRYVAACAGGREPVRLLVTAHDEAMGEAVRASVEIVCRLNAPARVFLRRRNVMQ